MAHEFDTSRLLSVPSGFIPELGGNPAYVLKVLAYRQSGAKRSSKGKLWFFCPIGRNVEGGKADALNPDGTRKYRPLVDEVPWLSTQGLHKIVTRLEKKGYLEVWRRLKGDLNNGKGYDNTLNYHVPKKVCERCKESENNEVRWFDPVEAERLGINSALVLNLIYRDFRLKVVRDDQRLVFSRKAIAKDLGLATSSVNDAINHIEAHGYISGFDTLEGRTYRLMVQNPSKLKGTGAGRKLVSTGTAAVEVEQLVNPILTPFPVKKRTDDVSPLRAIVEGAMAERKRLLALKKAKKSVTPKEVTKRRRGLKPEEADDLKITSPRGYHQEKRDENKEDASYRAIAKRQKNKQKLLDSNKQG